MKRGMGIRKAIEVLDRLYRAEVDKWSMLSHCRLSYEERAAVNVALKYLRRARSGFGVTARRLYSKRIRRYERQLQSQGGERRGA